MLQQLRRDLGAAGGGVSAKDQRHAKPVEQAAVGRIEQRLALNGGQGGLEQIDEQRGDGGGHDGFWPKLDPQHPHPDDQKGDVQYQQRHADRPAPEAVGEHGERGEAAGHDVVGIEEDVDRKRYAHAAGEDERDVEEEAAGHRAPAGAKQDALAEAVKWSGQAESHRAQFSGRCDKRPAKRRDVCIKQYMLSPGWRQKGRYLSQDYRCPGANRPPDWAPGACCSPLQVTGRTRG